MRCKRVISLVAVATIVLVARHAAAQTLPSLSLTEAEQRALQNHPQVREGRYGAEAASGLVQEVRSAYWPTVLGSVSGAEAKDSTRITAGGLNNPTVFDRFAYGVSGGQLVTDFGRTSNLSASASLEAQSAEEDVSVRRARVLLGVDDAYYDALRAQAVQRVADQTVTARQDVVDQVTALAAAGSKSSLDVSFARVNLSSAKLLALEARNEVDASYATLAEAMGASDATAYALADGPLPAAPPSDAAALIAAALRDRPDAIRDRLAQRSTAEFADAEGDLARPTISILGAAGLTPYRDASLAADYAAVGVTATIPLFNGHLYGARHAVATFRASAESEAVRDLENQISHDVRVAWLAAETAFQRVDLTDQLASEANDALDLAQQRYSLGLSSIVELSQAQLNQTQAQIAQATARYEYEEQTAALRFQTGALR